MPTPSLTRRERLRRVGILCCSCARNLAYYRAGWNGPDSVFDRSRNIIRTINSNFVDMAVLEWCKLFDSNEHQGWRRVVTDTARFESELLAHLHITAAQLDTFHQSMRLYRDKFLAHLDSERTMHIPDLALAKSSILFYYDYLQRHETDPTTFADGPADLAVYYGESEQEARRFYGA